MVFWGYKSYPKVIRLKSANIPTNSYKVIEKRSGKMLIIAER